MSSTRQDPRPGRPPIFSSLVTKISILLFLTLVLTLTSAAGVWIYLVHTEDHLEAVDELGRQRMLSMQMVSLAQQLDITDEKLGHELQESANDFSEVLARILDDENQHLSSSQLILITSTTAKQWAQLTPHIDILVDEDTGASQRRRARDFLIVQGPELAELSDQAVKAYRDEADRRRQTIWRLVLGAVAFNLSLLILGSYLTHRTVVRPIRHLSEAAYEFGEGRFQSRITSTNNDELGVLEEAFNTMAAELQEHVKALEQERQFAQSVVSNAPAGVIIHRDGNILFSNREMYRLLGLDDDQPLQNQPILDLFHPDDRSLAATLTTDFRPGNENPQQEVLRLSFEERDEVTTEVLSTELDYRGKPAVMTLLRDITAKQELTAQMMQMDRVIAIGTMVAGVGHEINNPLSFVIANLDFAHKQLEPLRTCSQQESELSARDCQRVLDHIEEALDDALEGGRRIQKIVAQLRSFTTPNNDSPAQAVDLRAPLESAIDMARFELRRRAKLVYQFEATPNVEAVESELAQVFFNLLLNAAHAIDADDTKTDHTITVALFSKDDEVIVEITDTGCGIDDKYTARIFDPFFTTKAPGQGTGLGLSICRNIVEAHSGSLTFDSIVDQGTTFRLVLPAIGTDSRSPDS